MQMLRLKIIKEENPFGVLPIVIMNGPRVVWWPQGPVMAGFSGYPWWS